MSTFGGVLEEEQAQERRKALKALLMQPLITAEGRFAEEFVLIRRHAAALSQWLARNAGWRLYVDSETARLRKTPPSLNDATRGIQGTRCFNRQRYALFCLAAVALGQGERQTTLGKLFEGIIRLAAADPELVKTGLQLEPERRDHRRDLVEAVHLMMDNGIMHHVDGDELAYLNGHGDVLFNVNRSALAWLLQTTRAPSTVEAQDTQARMQAITHEYHPDTPDGSNRRIRNFLTRKLLDDPVLYLDTLDPAEKGYLTNQRVMIGKEIQAATGLIPEIRAEGMAMVDLQGDLTDMGMPKTGTEGHITLLVAEYLAGRIKVNPDREIGLVELEGHMEHLIRDYGRHWSKIVKEADASRNLVEMALYRLTALDLITRREDGNVRPRPAIARYALDQPRHSQKQPQQATLL